jgi:hypothetical protein
MEPIYLGDGLDASFDGYYIALTANRGSSDQKTVYLEPGGWPKLAELAEQVWGEGSES